MNRGQGKQGVRQWNMNEQPGVQPAVETRLTSQLALFVADAFEILQRVVQLIRQTEAQLLENSQGLRGIGQRRTAARRIVKEGPEAAKIKLAQLIAGFLADFGANLDGGRGTIAAGRGAHGGSSIERAAGGVGKLIGFLAKLRANVADLFVNRFHRDFDGDFARDVRLQHGSEDAAGDHDEKQHHQDKRERAAHVKSGVKQNDGQADETEPEMTAHPRLRAADAPDGKSFPRAKKPNENHERKAHGAESDADGAAAARALRRRERAGNINSRCDDQKNRRGDHPLALGMVE